MNKRIFSENLDLSDWTSIIYEWRDERYRPRL